MVRSSQRSINGNSRPCHRQPLGPLSTCVIERPRSSEHSTTGSPRRAAACKVSCTCAVSRGSECSAMRKISPETAAYNRLAAMPRPPNFKQDKKRREEAQKKRNQEKQQERAQRRGIPVDPPKDTPCLLYTSPSPRDS